MRGIAGAVGISIGEVKVIESKELGDLVPDYTEIDSEKEIERYTKGAAVVREYFLTVSKKLSSEFSADEAEIYEGYIEILEDEDLNDEITALLKEGRVHAESAVEKIYEQTRAEFQQMENEYFASRAQDIAGIKQKLIVAIHEGAIAGSLELRDNSVIVARDLSPADTAQLDMKKVSGFVLEEGSKNSHVAIIARSLQLPCVFGIKDICSCFQDGTQVIVDGFSGEIFTEPDKVLLDKYRRLKDEYTQQQEQLKKVLYLPSCTHDGHCLKIGMNASTIVEVTETTSTQVDAIGLFRTEFIFMKEDDFPGVNKQYGYYKDVVTAMKGKNCIFRLLDIGGDKPLRYAPYPKELNPFLGWRAIRYCFDNMPVLINQLHALIKASAHGKVSILIPMVASVEEVLFIKKQMKNIMLQCKDEGVPFAEKIDIGIMIETPAAVALTPDLAREVDFFSIGTNDLTQYTLAVDRGNPKVHALYEEYHPAVIRLIAQTVKAAHAEGIWVGLCGELAADPKATPLLAGLGIDELSMNVASIPYVKKVLRSVEYDQCAALADDIVGLSRVDDIKKKVDKFITDHNLKISGPL